LWCGTASAPDAEDGAGDADGDGTCDCCIKEERRGREEGPAVGVSGSDIRRCRGGGGGPSFD
jgi:hypothetical protein